MANLPFLEETYQKYVLGKEPLDQSWSDFFQSIEKTKVPLPNIDDQTTLTDLINAYRKYGHLAAKVNPLTPNEPLANSFEMDLLRTRVEDVNKKYNTLGLLPDSQAPLSSIISRFKKLYCHNIGFEFKDFTDLALEEWIQQEIESGRFEKPFALEEKLSILNGLTRAQLLESFLHTKHVGKKRFSLEGAETLIPMLQYMVAKAADENVKEVIIGMSHRGRLNVLANILDKPILAILQDFDEDYLPASKEGTGDIRYHKGHANESINTPKGKSIKLSMAPNPSHLESVNPVVAGQTHAKQFLEMDEQTRTHIIPLLMHGDAALAGQGIVYETLQMGKLKGFETGGTIHIVINNQIGFTTSPQESRSTRYCTDIARSFGIPIFHINAEDPESCVKIILFALEIRQKFHTDVFVDLNCYRKYGHNEGDEPAFTQPLEYELIRNKRTIRALYIDQLIENGSLDKIYIEKQEEEYKKNLQEAFELAQKKIENGKKAETSIAEKKAPSQSIKTNVSFEMLKKIAGSLIQIPKDFHIHPKLAQVMTDRVKMIEENKPIDWGMGEFLAYGTLVMEGYPVRLVGQDSGRGTFSHRHALWIDQKNALPYYPLSHLSEKQARFEVLNSCLSEAGALGFEYGYSTVCENGLTIWEAQYGDFANSAQVIIDQYIAGGEEKWGQTSGLTLFLPHGFEGQGPEHSSARFERFLMLTGHDNIQIVNPTLPAQHFHLLRRQVLQAERKPLIIMTPKTLLRFPKCTSQVSDFIKGQFSTILDDPKKTFKAKRLILCTGRIYYDLEAEREKLKSDDHSIIRIEQLYPFDLTQLQNILNQYTQVKEIYWVQEEPENMGAWQYISFYLREILPANIPFSFIGRERSASPATGFYAKHKQESSHILAQVFK